MSFKYLFFILAFSTLIMSGVLIKNSQEIEMVRIQTEKDAQDVANALQTQVLIDQVCAGRGGSFVGKTLDCY